jgi:uncharacterized repeat protein (TIGR02543 family)
MYIMRWYGHQVCQTAIKISVFITLKEETKLKKRFSKFLALALAMIMVMTALPVSAFEYIGGGSIDIGSPDGFDRVWKTFTANLDNGMDVKVEVPKGAFPNRVKNLNMVATAINNLDAVQEAVNSTQGVNGTVLAAVDITFLSGTREIQPVKDVKVTITSDEFNGRDDLSVVHLDVDADELNDANPEAESVDNVSTTNNTVVFNARSFSVYAVTTDGSEDVKFLTVTFKDADGTTVINKQKIRMDRIAEMDPIIYDPGVPSLTANQAFTGWGTSVPGDTYTEDSGTTVEDINNYISANYQSWNDDVELTYYAQVFEVVFIFYCDQYGAVYNTEVKGRGEPFTYATDYVPEGGNTANLGVVGWVRYSDHTYVEKEGEGTTLPVYTSAAPAEAALHVPGETDTANGELILFPYITEGHWVQFDANYRNSSDPDTRATFTAPRFVANGGTLAKPTDPTRPGYELEGWYTDANLTNRFKFADESGATAVNAPMTLYAKWTPQQVTFHYVIWTQKADDAFDMDNDLQIYQNSSNGTTATYTDTANTYDYKDMTGLTGYVATGTATAGTYLSSLSANTDLGGTESRALGYYFLYNGAKTQQELGNTVIKGDGSTVIGVYYDRKVITFRFGTGTEKYYQVSNPDWDNYSYYVKSGSAYYYSFYDSDTHYYYTELIGNASTSSTYYVIYNGTICPLNYYSGYGWYFRYNGSDYAYSSGAVYTRSNSAPSPVYAKAAELTSSNVRYTRRGLYGAQIDPTGSEWPSASSGNTWANYDPAAGSVFLYPLNLTEYVPTWQNNAVTTSLDFYETDYESKITVKYVGQTLSNNNVTNTYSQILATGTAHTDTHWYPAETIQGFTVYGYAFSSSSTAPTTWNTPVTTSSQIPIADGETRNLYLAFKRNSYKLTFYSQGNELTSLSKASVYYQAGLSAYKPAKADEPTSGPYGKYFTKWYADPECKVEFDWTQSMPAHDVAVYAGWTDEWYRLVFDITGNGAIDANTVTVPDGQAISFTLGFGQKVESTALNQITTSVPGYVFGGWYYDANFENRFDMSTEMNPDMPNLDKTYKDSSKTGVDALGNTYDDSPWPDVRNKITLYARWLKRVAGASGISVIYDAVEGKGIIRSPYPEEVVKPDPILYTNGAVAFGRYAATPIIAQGDNAGEDDPERQFLYWEIRDTEGNVLRKVYPGQPFTIDINWAVETDSYTITWHYKNAAGGDISDTTKVAEGMKPSHAAPASYQIGDTNYIFDHWTPEVVNAYDDASYTAVYIEKTVVRITVTFDMNGTTETQQVVEGGYPTVPETITVPNGKRFIGWYMNGGTTLMSNEEVASTAITAATTFTAQYEDAGYTVTFNANGGTFANGSETYTVENVPAGTKVSSLFPTSPTHSTTGMYFYGWFTQATDGSVVTATNDITVNSNVTVHAHWYKWTFVQDKSGTLQTGDIYTFDVIPATNTYYSIGNTNSAEGYLYPVNTSSSVDTTAQWRAVSSSTSGYVNLNSVASSTYYMGEYGSDSNGWYAYASATYPANVKLVASSSSGRYYLYNTYSEYLAYAGSSSRYQWVENQSSATAFYVYKRTQVDQNVTSSKGVTDPLIERVEVASSFESYMKSEEIVANVAETTAMVAETFVRAAETACKGAGEPTRGTSSVNLNRATTTVDDTLTRSTTGQTSSNSYGNWSGKSLNSDAVYAGNSAGGNSSIQLRSNYSSSGIISTTSGGKIRQVTVTWNSNTTNGRTLNIYGSNSAYSAASDLYSDSTQGTLLGTIVYGTSTTLTITGDYAYVGVRSNSGAMYLTNITFTWEVETPDPTGDIWVPTNTIETGKDYLIGYVNGSDTYLLMNYNPNPITSGYNQYYSSTHYYSYAVKAIKSGNNVTGVNTSTYSGAAIEHVTWRFITSGSGYTIQSQYNTSYFLRAAEASGYYDLIATDNSSVWTWDSTNKRFSATPSSTTKYMTFAPTVGSYSNFFYAPSSVNSTYSTIQLYVKQTTAPTTYTLTINYQYENGTQAAQSHVEQLAENASYSVVSPVIEGYTASQTTVSGTMPAENVTVNVIYTAIPATTYTVTYMVNGAQYGQTVTVAENGTVTLPTSVTGVPSDYEFEGWVTEAIPDETTTAPTAYDLGYTYTVTGNVTFYALFTRTESIGEVIYQLTDHIEDGKKYILVDTNSISETVGYAVGNAIVSNNHYLNAVSVTVNSTDNTVTATTTNLPKVVWAAAGSDSAGYSFYNEAVGKYMGLDSSEYLYPSGTAVAWKYTTDQYLDNQVDSEGYYYLSYDTSEYRYTTNRSGKVIRLYAETEVGTTYYTTQTETLYTLTINYVVPAGYTAPEAYVGSYAEGDTYSVESPAVEGLNVETGKETVTGTMPAQDLTITVNYTAKPSHTVTVVYVGPNDGSFVAPANAVVTVVEGETYSIGSPEVYGYEPDQDIVSGVMDNENVTVTVTYTKVDFGDKTYTITLYAVYGRANTDGRTHVYWYSNDNTATEVSGGYKQQDIVDINDPFNIPTPSNFLVGTINHDTRGDIVSGETHELIWADHVFLGWARIEDPTNADMTGSAHHELNEDDLYLRWTGTGYQVETKDGWVDVTKVAADEMRPYHDMYAVWAEVFYVYHSGSNEVERVVRTTKAATYDLTANLTEGTLYGGYYSDYTGKSDNFAAKDLNWAATVTASQLRNGLYTEEKDDTGANHAEYTGVNKTWSAGAVYMTPGNALVPVAGATYYIKEVPADKYLRPYLHYTYYGVQTENGLSGSGKIASLYAISDIDDLLYYETGFIITDAGNKTAKVVKSLTIKPANNPDNAVTLTANELFGVGDRNTTNRLTYLKLFDESAADNIVDFGSSFSVSRYWKTPDGLYVTGVVTTAYTGTGNVTSIAGADATVSSMINANINSIISALGAN